MTAWKLVTSGSVLALILTAPVVATAQGARGTPTPTAGGTQTNASQTQEIGPLEKAANPITPENPIPRRSYALLPGYPAEAAGTGVVASVTVKLTLNQSGNVAEARQTEFSSAGATVPASIQAAFRKAALDAVRQWTYDTPANAPISLFVQLSFVPDSESRVTWHDATVPPSRTAGATATAPPRPTVAGALRVGGQIGAPKKVKHVDPVYPPIAQSARVSGIVIIEVTLGTDGRVVDAVVLRSIPLLDQAALDAVRQWEFTPVLLNGSPVPIVMSVTLNFSLD